MSKVQLNAYIVIAILLLVTAAVKTAKPFTVQGRPNTDFSRIPLNVGEWKGKEGSFDKQTRELLSSCSLLSRFYQRDYDIVPVGFAVVYGTDLKDFHQPEVCLEGQGLRAVSKTIVRVRDGEGSTFPAVGLVTEADYRRQVFVYWFYTEGMSSTSLGRYKINMLRDRLFMRRVQPSAMIRLSTVVYDTESEQDALDRVIVLADVLFPYLKRELSASESRD